MADIVKTYEELPGGGVQEVRKFSDSRLQESINNALAGLTGDERAVVLQLEKNSAGLNTAIAARLNGHWSIAAAYNRGGTGGWAAGTTIKFAW